MSTQQPRATHSGKLEIGKLQLDCYVLEDGRRVLSQRGINEALGAKITGGHSIARFSDSERLKPYLDQGNLIARFDEIRFLYRNREIQGCDARVLTDICGAIVEAHANGDLHKNQHHLAKQASTLLRAFSEIGVTALIDEATGYADKKKRDEYQKLLKLVCADEIQPWMKRFSDDIPVRICQLRNWAFDTKKKQGPRAIAQIYQKYVYNMLPPGAKEVLYATTRGENGEVIAKLHQGLTPEAGVKLLDQQIHTFKTLLFAARSWGGFVASFNAYYAHQGNAWQVALFDDDDFSPAA